jgi:hypothetical protein
MDQEIPTWLKVTIFSVLAIAGLVVFFNYDGVLAYGTYIREKSPDVNLNMTGFSVDMDESKVRKHFEGVRLICVPERRSDLGDRVCYAVIDKADGDPALTLVAFLKAGKLAHVLVQVPWWVHKTWIDRLALRFGSPGTSGETAAHDNISLKWKMPNGFVEVNRERRLNPLAWNIVMWTGQTL